MTKNVFDGRVETTITAEKESSFKRNTTDLSKNYGYFKQQAYDFLIEKSNLPEMTVLYMNQAYQSYKGNKKIYYCDLFILGQVIPFLSPLEDLINYEPLSNEAKIIRLKCDVVSRQFLGLGEILGYLAVRWEDRDCFFEYGYSKENSTVLCSCQKNENSE